MQNANSRPDQENINENDDPLLKMDNVVATPHLGYVEKDGYELYFSAAFRNIIGFCQRCAEQPA